MKIGIVGAGYVGLVTGVCLAEMGNHVTIVDVDTQKIATLKDGRCPHFEQGLEELLGRNAREGRLAFTTEVAAAGRGQEAVFLAVGTPMSADGSANLEYITAAAAAIARALTQKTAIIIKSTVPVGTNRAVTAQVRAATAQEFTVISNPEFLKEGAAVNDFLRPDRVIVGVRDPWAEKIIRQIYDPFVRSGRPIMVMDPESAEMVKYASNAMLASRISFMNEIANLCARVGADVECVRRGVGSDSRIGSAFLFPGLGYGGSCFPKDVRALVKTAQRHGLEAPLFSAIDTANVRQRLALLPAILEYFSQDIRGRRFAFWGVAFKALTDDVREAPALYLARALLERGGAVTLYDPQALAKARQEMGDSVNYAENAYAALDGADVLVICTEWNEFRSPDFARIKALLRCPAVFDGRNLYNPEVLRDAGFAYYSIGRPAVARG